MANELRTIKANFSNAGAIRRAVHDGRDHIVVPVVMIVEGVLNDALLTQAEFGKYPDAWNGRPVPILHPEKNGVHVSANSPDIIEKSAIGFIFNTHADAGKLKGEVWVDIDKAERLGQKDLVAQLEAGKVVEVSTGYFADYKEEAGEFNGKPYSWIDVNIRPDHLALLPGQVGACSVADGCGTRVNAEKGFLMKTKDAINTLMEALGLRGNCSCDEEVNVMSTWKEKLGELKANEKLTPKQIQMLMEFDEEQLAMIGALAKTLGDVGGGEEAPAAEPEEMAEGGPAAELLDEEPVAMTAKQIQAMVDSAVAEGVERAEVTAKLTANERCPFDSKELRSMSVAQLKKLEASIRPADYSGQGGFASNADAATEEGYQPLTIHSGLTARKQKQEV